MAVAEFFGAEVVWVSEVEKPLLDRYTVPNLGDVTKVDWSEVEPVDILCGGYPCQPFSAAGRRGGFEDARDLWPAFARAIRILRPRFVIAENVAGHLQFGFDRTLCDLAEMGFDARWGVVRASEAGAPHRRERVFLLAYPTSERGPGESGELDERGALVGTESESSLGDSRGHLASGVPELGRGAGQEPFDWGTYGQAIERWEIVMGRSAPHPVDAKGRLDPDFVEWMMGFPAGHTSGLSRSQRLKALGNAVVPNQAYYALNRLAS